jgi:hypothetical protein
MGQGKTIQEWYDICQLPPGDYETGFERFAVRLSRGEFLWDAMTRKNPNKEAVAELEAMKAAFKKNRVANKATKRRASGGPTVMECTVKVKAGKLTIKRDADTSILIYKGESTEPEPSTKGLLKSVCSELALSFEKPANDYNTRQLGVRVITAVNQKAS